MKKLINKIAILGLVTCVTATVSPFSGAGSKGEGDIPVVRVFGTFGRSTTVNVTDSSGTQYVAYSDNSGIVRLPQMPSGAATFNLQTPEMETMNYTLTLGSEQRRILNAHSVPIESSGEVIQLMIKLPGYQGSLDIGSRQPIIVEIVGAGLQGLKPTVWVSGGVGMMDTGNQLIPTVSGSGRIHAELLGKTASVEIRVD